MASALVNFRAAWLSETESHLEMSILPVFRRLRAQAKISSFFAATHSAKATGKLFSFWLAPEIPRPLLLIKLFSSSAMASLTALPLPLLLVRATFSFSEKRWLLVPATFSLPRMNVSFCAVSGSESASKRFS